MKKHRIKGKNITTSPVFMTNYVVMGFTFKQRDTIEENPRNFFKQVLLTSLLSKHIQTITRRIIARGSQNGLSGLELYAPPGYWAL